MATATPKQEQPCKLSTVKILWIIASLSGLLLLLVSFFIPAQTVLEHTPTCYSVRQFGRQCFMCGSTRSFIKLAAGNFSEAWALNRLAFVLFISIVANTAAFAIYFVTNKTKHIKK